MSSDRNGNGDIQDIAKYLLVGTLITQERVDGF